MIFCLHFIQGHLDLEDLDQILINGLHGNIIVYTAIESINEVLRLFQIDSVLIL